MVCRLLRNPPPPLISLSSPFFLLGWLTRFSIVFCSFSVPIANDREKKVRVDPAVTGSRVGKNQSSPQNSPKLYLHKRFFQGGTLGHTCKRLCFLSSHSACCHRTGSPHLACTSLHCHAVIGSLILTDFHLLLILRKRRNKEVDKKSRKMRLVFRTCRCRSSIFFFLKHWLRPSLRSSQT